MINYECHKSTTKNLFHAYNTNFEFEKHLHTNIEFVHCIEGQLLVECDGTKYTLNAGNSILILPSETHSFQTPKSSKSYICVFSGDFVPCWLSKIENSKKITLLAKRTFDNISHQEIIEFESSTCLFMQKSFLYKICSYASGSGFVELDIKQNHIPLDIQIINYINQNYQENLTIQMLSEIFSYNERYLTAYFHRTLGTSFRQYLNSIRISHALKDLEETKKPISQITFDHGFSSIRHFNRIFFENYKTSPSKFRSNWLAPNSTLAPL